MALKEPTHALFEWEGLQKEHKIVRLQHSDNEGEKLWRLSGSLRTLFYKIMLRLLGYSGEYFDYAKHEVQNLNPAPSAAPR